MAMILLHEALQPLCALHLCREGPPGGPLLLRWYLRKGTTQWNSDVGHWGLALALPFNVSKSPL